MNYTVSRRKEHGYIKLTFFDTVAWDVLYRSQEETYYKFITSGYCKVFIDVIRSNSFMSATELMVFMHLFKWKRFLMGMSFAVLARPDQIELL